MKLIVNLDMIKLLIDEYTCTKLMGLFTSAHLFLILKHLSKNALTKNFSDSMDEVYMVFGNWRQVSTVHQHRRMTCEPRGLLPVCKGGTGLMAWV